MDPTILVERDVEEGRRLIQALDTAGFPVIAALWCRPSEEDYWQLVIASPTVRESGPLPAYRKIQEVLRSSEITLPLMRVSAASPDDQLITALRIDYPTAGVPFVGGTYLHRAGVGSTTVRGAYVYRAERMFPESGTTSVVTLVREKQARIWRAFPGTLTFKDGLLQEITIEGHDWPQKRSRNGLTTKIYLLDCQERKDGHLRGDVKRMVFVNGQLKSVDNVARGVRIEGASGCESRG